MSKDKSSKKEHKKSRDEKASSPVAGDVKVKKDKKDKKDKKSKRSTSPAALLDAVVKTDADVDPMKMEVDTDGKILGGTMENAVVVKADGEEIHGALVPFAKPLAEGKLAKKVLKTVKKGTFFPVLLFFHIDFCSSLYYPVPIFGIITWFEASMAPL